MATSDPLTPEERSALSRAGRKANAKRWGDQRAAAAHRDPAIPGKIPSNRQAALGDYDSVLGDPATWSDAKAREQVQAEILSNEKLLDEAEVRRGAMFTREMVAERDMAYDEEVLAVIDSVRQLIHEVTPPERRPAALDAAKQWIAASRTKLAERKR